MKSYEAHPVIVAPFANERLREWPLDNFRELIECGLKDGYRFVISGTQAQRPLANQLIRTFSSELVSNACGTTTWPELQSLLKNAPFIVANNSGIAHLAANLGKWVLCVFAGSHSWIEWMPRGEKVVTMARMPACAPCESRFCTNGGDCMSNLRGALAYSEITSIITEHNHAKVRSGT